MAEKFVPKHRNNNRLFILCPVGNCITTAAPIWYSTECVSDGVCADGKCQEAFAPPDDTPSIKDSFNSMNYFTAIPAPLSTSSSSLLVLLASPVHASSIALAIRFVWLSTISSGWKYVFVSSAYPLLHGSILIQAHHSSKDRIDFSVHWLCGVWPWHAMARRSLTLARAQSLCTRAPFESDVYTIRCGMVSIITAKLYRATYKYN